MINLIAFGIVCYGLFIIGGFILSVLAPILAIFGIVVGGSSSGGSYNDPWELKCPKCGKMFKGNPNYYHTCFRCKTEF